jgi:hypothetical protein
MNSGAQIGLRNGYTITTTRTNVTTIIYDFYFDKTMAGDFAGICISMYDVSVVSAPNFGYININDPNTSYTPNIFPKVVRV